MKVLVESTNLREVKSKKDGQIYHAQDIRIVGNKLAGPSNVFVNNQIPYPIGEYTIDIEDCLRFGSFGRLEFSLVLKQSANEKNDGMIKSFRGATA